MKNNIPLKTIYNFLLVLTLIFTNGESINSHFEGKSPFIQIDPAQLKVPLKVEPNQYLTLSYIDEFTVPYQGETYDAQTFLLYVSFKDGICNSLIAMGDETIEITQDGYIWAIPLMEVLEPELESLAYALQHIMDVAMLEQESIPTCRLNFSKEAQVFLGLQKPFMDIGMPNMLPTEDTSDKKLA